MESGDHRGAVELLDALSADQLSAETRVGIGFYYLEAGRNRRALAAAERVLASEANVGASQLRAIALAAMRRYDEAATASLEVDGDAETRARAISYAAEMTALAGRREQALDMLAVVDAELPRAQIGKARVHELSGDLSRARVLFEDGARRWPGDPEATMAWAGFELRSGDAARAASVAGALLERDPNSLELQNFVGFALAESGTEFERAERLLQRALRRAPDSSGVIDSYGWLLYRRGDLGGAAVWLRRAARLAPAEAEILFHLAHLERALGRTPAALRVFRRAREVSLEPSLRARIDAQIQSIERREVIR